MVQNALHQFAIRVGLAQKDTTEVEVTVTIPGTNEYGSLEYDEYWVKQTYQNCQLMSSAMAIAQALKIPTPSEETMVARARTTDSVRQPGYKMYSGEDTEDGAYGDDAVVLMETYWPVTAEETKYGTRDENGELSSFTIQDTDNALSDLKAALASGYGATVGVDSNTIWTAVGGHAPIGLPQLPRRRWSRGGGDLYRPARGICVPQRQRPRVREGREGADRQLHAGMAGQRPRIDSRQAQDRRPERSDAGHAHRHGHIPEP